jgi:hypothetical protein
MVVRPPATGAAVAGGGYRFVVLPSSSAAYAERSFDEKLAL